MALAAALGLATVVAWRASKRDSVARRKARAAIAALQRCAESAVQWTAASATKGVLQGGVSWASQRPEFKEGSEGRQRMEVLSSPSEAVISLLLMRLCLWRALACVHVQFVA